MSKTFSFLRYANCWEDTDILLEGLQIAKNETGLSVASGGDNTLAMLNQNPKKIYAFDLNPTQLYCLELKMVCIRRLPYATTLSFLGIGECDRLSVYAAIRGELSAGARSYFDQNSKLIRTGIIHAGKFERYFQIFRRFIIPLFSSKKTFYRFSQLENPAEQKVFYDKRINNRRLKMLFAVYFGSKVMGRLGRDKSFYDYVEDEKDSGKDIGARFEYGISHTKNRFNPYLNYIVNQTFFADCLPTYLKKENYETIRQNLDRIELIHGDLCSIQNERFDFFNLSDIFEYMSEADFKKNIRHLLTISNENARIAYWNMQNKRYIQNKCIAFEKELSEQLFEKNRSYFYRDFLIYQVRKQHEQDR